jgi:hypothetical protein
LLLPLPLTCVLAQVAPAAAMLTWGILEICFPAVAQNTTRGETVALNPADAAPGGSIRDMTALVMDHSRRDGIEISGSVHSSGGGDVSASPIIPVVSPTPTLERTTSSAAGGFLTPTPAKASTREAGSGRGGAWQRCGHTSWGIRAWGCGASPPPPPPMMVLFLPPRSDAADVPRLSHCCGRVHRGRLGAGRHHSRCGRCGGGLSLWGSLCAEAQAHVVASVRGGSPPARVPS